MSKRPFLVIILLVAAFIGLAWATSRLHPGGELPPAEKQEIEDQQKLDEAKKAAEAQKKESDTRQATMDRGTNAFDKVKEGAVRVTLEIEGRGTMVLELYPKAAPQTVAHVTDLIKKNFYTGIKVHRIETTGIHVVQMGDPVTKNIEPSAFEANHIGGNPGPGPAVPLEASLPHAKYSIGLARTQDPNSGDNQFYINSEANPELDGSYCVFGRIVEGMDVVPNIKIGDSIKRMVLN